MIEGLLHRNRALNGDVVVCVMLPTQIANKECEKCFVQGPNIPSNRAKEQPTPNNLAAVSELKENFAKVTENEVQCADSELAASRELRTVKNSKPKNKKTKKKSEEDNKNLVADLQSKNEDVLANRSNVANVII